MARMMAEQTVGRKERMLVVMWEKKLGMNWAGQKGFEMLASVLVAMMAASLAMKRVGTMGTNLVRALAVPKDVVWVGLMVRQKVEWWVAAKERSLVELVVAG